MTSKFESPAKASLRRIKSVIMEEVYQSKWSIDLFFNTIVFPMMSVVMFGLMSHYLGAKGGVAQYFLVGILFWEMLRIVQCYLTLSSLWEVWSQNLTNFFITPVSTWEYLTAHGIAAVCRAVIIVTMLSVGSYWIFGFNLAQLGLVNLLLFAVNLIIFSFWAGLLILGLVFRFGTKVQSITWGAIWIFQPLMGTFFPVSVLPHFMQVIAYCLPPTYIFEAARQALTTPGINWKCVLTALVLNICYFSFALLIFNRMFKRSKESGQFARNDM
jgi:ABC-2 type transport system permease protein